MKYRNNLKKCKQHKKGKSIAVLGIGYTKEKDEHRKDFKTNDFRR